MGEESINKWNPGVLGGSDRGHELFYEYKLSAITTTTTTTTTTFTETSLTETTITVTQTSVTETTFTVTNTSVTSTTTTLERGNCEVFGDPHVIGFDKGSSFIAAEAVKAQHPLLNAKDAEKNAVGDFWLVKSELILIQGRYEVVKTSHRGGSFMTRLAVGGPILGNNTLIVGSKDTRCWWTQHEILSHLPARYLNDYITADYLPNSTLVQDDSREAAAVDVEMPMGIHLHINRGENGVGVSINMPKFATGQDGQCGNFNGIAGDDTEELISRRVGTISRDEVLFHNPFKA